MLSDEELRENIRKNLAYMRNQHGLTQNEVADIIGRPPTTVASWEQGLSLPNLQTLYRLSIYYRKTMEWFYEHKEGDDD
jgi:transcriptional regulator with XRE-family HTH domain